MSKKLLRNLVVFACASFALAALYTTRFFVYAGSVSGAITSVSSGYLTYTGTSFDVYYVGINGGLLTTCAQPASNYDVIYAYLSTSSSSGSFAGVPSTSGTICSSYPAWTGIVSLGTTYQNFTGSSLYLHVLIKDSTLTTTKGYGYETITFVASGSGGPDWNVIYTSIGSTLISQGIYNNFNTVTNGNVSNFSGLYFAKMSGASEMGRITFSTGLDLTDTGTQNFLSGELPNSIGMDQGEIWFNPGTGFVGKSATLKMNMGDYLSGLLVGKTAADFAVREGSGGALTGTSMISTVNAGTCSGNGMFACPIYLNVSHFTQFDLKPFITAANIVSSNSISAKAKSGDVITLSFTGSEPLTSVTVLINGQSATVNGGGNSRVATYTTRAVDSGTVTFTINYSDMYGNTGTTQTTTTNASSVFVDNIAPSAPVISTPSSTVAASSILLTGTAESGAIITIYSGATPVASGLSTTTFSISVNLNTGTNVFQAYAMDPVGNLSTASSSVTITRDTTTLVATINYTTTGLTNQNVTGYISFNKTGVTIDNNGGLSGYLFTGNTSFTFNYHDSLTSGSATATVTWIDKTSPTATVSYSPASSTNQDVVATLTGWSETLTGLNASTKTFTGNGGFVFTFSDLAGNTGSQTATVTWIDKTAVVGTISYSSTGATSGNIISYISFNKTGVTVTNNGGSTGYTFTNTGTFTFNFQDTPGNTGTATATVTWIDKVAPATPVITTTAQTTTGTTITLAGTAENLATIYVYNGGTYIKTGSSNGTFGISVSLNDGVNTFTVKAQDVVGNISSLSTGVNITKSTVISTSTITSTTTATGAATIGGATSTGATFTSTGTLVITNSNNSVSLPVSGLVITKSGASWDYIIQAPVTTSFTGTASTITNYTHQASLTYKIGSDATELILSGQVATVTLYVGTTYNSQTLKIYRSTDNGVSYSYLAACGVSNGSCSFTTDKFSIYTVYSPTTSSGGGGGGGGGENTTTEDDCPDGDRSGSNSDGLCSAQITTVKLSGSILNSPYSVELNEAYVYAYDIGITTIPTIQKANMEGSLIRAHMAKMMVNYAIKVLSKTIDPTFTGCQFADVADQTQEMKNYIKWDCQLGIMGVNASGKQNLQFNPNNTVTRAEFGTVLSRVLYGTQYNGGQPYYIKHLQILKDKSIISKTDPLLQETRGFVMLMLKRAKDKK